MAKKKPLPPGPPAFDRGSTPYFHGRNNIFNQFRILLGHSLKTNTGTTFIIQGAPGSGKTALLDKIAKDAIQPWHVAHIDPDALWDTNWLMHALGRGREFSISEWIGGVGLGVAGGKAKSNPVLPNPISIIGQWNIPLLLILDEAQNLGGPNKPEGNNRSDAANLIRRIHNGDMGRPVVLLCAGLGTTLGAFDSLGLSRIGLKCDAELGPLSDKSTRAIVQAWLTKDAGAKGDTAPWVDAITEETQGWPQHIAAYVEPAIMHLMENGGRLTSAGLSIVLKLGREGRAQYYQQRVRKFYIDEVRHMANAISEYPSGSVFDRLDVLSSLSRIYGHAEAIKIFDTFLERWIIDASGSEGYVVSIPSMHTWLVDEYVNNKS
ncbi:MAG: hypothetical protein OXF06_10300 [Bacteroidetes bacterium]|nr:hypothetical protein [Bacteroidota bacterium]